MKDFAKTFYASRQWHECRDSYIKKRLNIDGGMCEQCHKALGFIVHHKIELNPYNIKDSKISLNHDNFEFVCLECHNIIHDVYQSHSRVMFDEEGNCIERPNPPSKIIR